MIAVFVVINLFIAVVLNNLEATRRDEARARADHAPYDAGTRIAEIRERLDELERQLQDGSPKPPRGVAGGPLRGTPSHRDSLIVPA